MSMRPDSKEIRSVRKPRRLIQHTSNIVRMPGAKKKVDQECTPLRHAADYRRQDQENSTIGRHLSNSKMRAAKAGFFYGLIVPWGPFPADFQC